jgi:PAS domain S-box-containing protein
VVAAAEQSRGGSDVDLFAAAPDGILIVDESGTIIAANEHLEEMFGFERGELVGQVLETLLPERFAESHVAHRKAYFARPTRRPMGATLRLYGRRRSGDEFPVDISLNYERTADGSTRAIAFVRDITERRTLEEELRASEENFRLLVEGIGDHALMMLDPSGRVVTWNPEAERIKGWAADEIIGRHFSVFYLPDDIASGKPARDLERAAAEGRAQDAGWRVRGDGRRFWADTTLSAVRDEHGVLRGYAKATRDRTESHQTRARLEALSELNRAALEQRPEDELLAVVLSRVRAMVDATTVAAWTVNRDGQLAVVHADGDGAARLVGLVAGDDSLITNVARSARCEVVRDASTDDRVPQVLVDAGVRSAVFVPLVAADELFAVIGVLRDHNREPFQPHETDLLQSFGLQAAAAFALARARREVEQLHIISDRERIARDLHDTVIQRLFAVGLALEATARRPAAETQERIQRAVADIDDTIRAIRSVIFSLEATEETRQGLRARVLDVVAESTPTLGFEPAVTFQGPVDTLADEHLAGEIAAVLREALANAARHAHARRVTVTLTADRDMHLVVDDDGTGAEHFHRAGGHGVANLVERARQLGGDASVVSIAPHGTRVEWRVPLRTSS